MNKIQLNDYLANSGINKSAYSLSGGLPNERYVLSEEFGEWVVYYSERGQKRGEKRFSSESDACDYLLSLLARLNSNI